MAKKLKASFKKPWQKVSWKNRIEIDSLRDQHRERMFIARLVSREALDSEDVADFVYAILDDQAKLIDRLEGVLRG